MIDVTAAVRQVVANNAPVLCIDTCSLLDLTRDPMRPKFGRKHVEAALHLIGRVEAIPATLTIILTEQVIYELDANLAEIAADAERAIEKVNKALGICEAYGVSSGLSTPAVSAVAFTAAANGIIRRFLRSAVVVKNSAASPTPAWERVRDARAPATRGKNSMKDCVIIENYLQLIGAARAAGLTERALFLTSNTEDYAEGASRRLHSDLVVDFQNASLDFAVNFLEVRFRI
jgi:PIN domain-containing protein